MQKDMAKRSSKVRRVGQGHNKKKTLFIQVRKETLEKEKENNRIKKSRIK